jgi:S1-C subfamily serine protease
MCLVESQRSRNTGMAKAILGLTPIDVAQRAARPLYWATVRALPLVCAAWLAVGWTLPAAADTPEPSGLAVAAAMEGVLTGAIANAEKSVVAIARVKRNDRDDISPLELRADGFGRFQIPQEHRPGDPEFIPNEYATGVVVDRHGLILTNFHVLGEDSDLYVTTVDRRVYPAKIWAADSRSDLAVLSIDAKDLVPIQFGDANNLKKGQFVVVLGNPYAIARDGQASASWGIIANLERKAPPQADETSRSSLHQYGTLIQTDARLNLGTSGGALLNLKGEMIGLTTSLAAISGYEQAAGYAVPIDDTFRRVVETLKQGREVEYGFLGVAPKSLREADLAAGRRGVVVHDVVDGTPAKRSGLETGDLITHVDERPIYDADGLVLQVGKKAHDAVIRLSVERNGHTIPINVQLTKYPMRGRQVISTPAPQWRGLRVDYASTARDFQEGVRTHQIPTEGCVVVSSVEENSPAWQEGLRAEKVITHVDGVRVSSPKEFHAAVAGKTGPVTLRLVSPDKDQAVLVIPPAPAAAPPAADAAPPSEPNSR